MYFTKIALKWGPAVVRHETDGALSGLWFEGQKYFPKIPSDAVWTEDGSEVPEAVFKGIDLVKAELAAYEVGTLEQFTVSLAFNGTPFQKIVWAALVQIPYGATTTYGALSQTVAQVLGKPSMSAQAVGGAVGHNPISVIVPCHRVIGAGGQLTGYAGGLDKKRALLSHEGAILAAEG